MKKLYKAVRDDVSNSSVVTLHDYKMKIEAVYYLELSLNL